MNLIKRIIIFSIKKIIELIECYEYRNLNLNEDDNSKKIINTASIKNFNIKSDTGYNELSNVHITQPYRHYTICTKSFKLDCADNHILFNRNKNQIYAKHLGIGDEILTINGLEKVTSIKKGKFKSSMFDVTVNDSNHRLYTNGILSHNTVCSSITMLHYILFNNNKNVLVTANKLDTAIEVLDKIKEIYQKLPFFLQQGVVNWNQKFMIFENKSRIKGFATTKTSSIGQTADFLYLDEFAYLPNNIAEKFYKSVFPTVSNIENSKIIITSTPDGMNLFHRLLTDAEKPEGEKSSYVAKRVYWWQVPKRFATYIRINSKKSTDLGINKDDLLTYLIEKYKNNSHTLSFNTELKKWVITTLNTKDCTEEDVLAEEFNGIRLLEFCEITTWKKETIKDIGGEEAFNQEYDLRFINSSKSLLSEPLLEELNKNKEKYEWEKLDELERLKFSYQDLKWIQDETVYHPLKRKETKVVLTIDVSEGLGMDYSVINIFKVGVKSKELIEEQKHKYKDIIDMSQLTQIGIFRSNLVSVHQLSEILYLIAFEYFNPDNVKAVLELNTYGNELLAYMPGLFDGKNDYGSSIFFRYKHRHDANEEKVGLKINDNKKIFVKEYQERMENRNIILSNDINIAEATTFIKHTTSAGNTRYAADGSSNDDAIMTVVNMSSIFQKNEFKQIFEDIISNLEDTELSNYLSICLNEIEYIEPVDYSQILNIRRRFLNRTKPTIDSWSSINKNKL